MPFGVSRCSVRALFCNRWIAAGYFDWRVLRKEAMVHEPGANRESAAVRDILILILRLGCGGVGDNSRGVRTHVEDERAERVERLATVRIQRPAMRGKQGVGINNELGRASFLFPSDGGGAFRCVAGRLLTSAARFGDGAGLYLCEAGDGKAQHRRAQAAREPPSQSCVAAHRKVERATPELLPRASPGARRTAGKLRPVPAPRDGCVPAPPCRRASAALRRSTCPPAASRLLSCRAW